MENRADEDVLPLIKTARAERTVDELRGTPLEAQMHNAKSRLQNEGCRVFFFQERSSCADGYTGVCMSDDDACVSVIIIIIIVRAIYNSVLETACVKRGRCGRNSTNRLPPLGSASF